MKLAKDILSKLKYPEYWNTKTPSLESFLKYRREICPDEQLKKDVEHLDYIIDLEKICEFYIFKSCKKALNNFKSEAKLDAIKTFWNEQIELQRIRTLELLNHRAEATPIKKNEKDQEWKENLLLAIHESTFS